MVGVEKHDQNKLLQKCIQFLFLHCKSTTPRKKRKPFEWEESNNGHDSAELLLQTKQHLKKTSENFPTKNLSLKIDFEY